MRVRELLLLGALALTGVSAGLGQQQSANDRPLNQSLQQRYPRYQICAGDVLELRFEFNPEFNQVVTVEPDGFAQLRGLGELHVAGLTVPDLTRTLVRGFGGFLRDPVLSISLKEFEKPYFVATGMVAHPGKYELHGDLTVVQALAVAGGLTPAAKHSEVLLFRRVPDGWLQSRVIDVKKMTANRSLVEDVHLAPGDLLMVPQNKLSKIERFIPHSALNVNPYQF